METQLNFQLGQKLVHSKYSICHKIGTGSFSSVYSISLKKKGRVVIRAIKIQNDKVPHPQISTQISVLQNIEGTRNAQIGFTKLFEYGFEGDYNYIVMELLGPNLEQFLRLSGGKLSMKTVLILGLQMIDRIQVLHNAGFIYRDIKPQNFVMGIENKSHILHLIDFGKCKRYKNKQTGKHIPYKENARFDCEFMFSSINTHIGTQYSRRDDIQAIIYLLIYLRKGKLPWSLNKEFKSKKQRETTIEQVKKKLPMEHLSYKMPLSFVDLLSYVRTLNFFQKPDYDYIRLLLHRAFNPEEDNMSIVFDWNKMDQLDFAIYGGQPKIVLQPQSQKRDSYMVDVQKDDDQKMKIRQSNSIDVQLMMDKKASQNKDNIKEENKENKTNEDKNEVRTSIEKSKFRDSSKQQKKQTGNQLAELFKKFQ